jgi:hypothetical protein
MIKLPEKHDEIVSRVTDEQRVLHGGVSDGVEHLGRKEIEAAVLALAVGVVAALAVGVPQDWSLVMSVFIGFAAAVGAFVVAAIVLVERDDGRVSEQAHDEAQHPHHLRARWRGTGGATRRGTPGASAGALSRWSDDGGATPDSPGDLPALSHHTRG